MSESAQRQLHRRLQNYWHDNDALGRVMISLLVGTALVTVASVILESVWPVDEHHHVWRRLEWFAFVIFAMEYIGRLWLAPQDRRDLYSRPVLGRLRYAMTPMAILDLLAFAPSLVGLALPVERWVFNVLRLAAVAKLLRYSTAMEVLRAVVYQERRSLWSVTVVMAVLLVLVSSAMYLAENAAQPQVFSSIPAAMWWGIVTLTTVGYGDMTPVTQVGRVCGAITAVLGLGMFAMPAAILANGFAREMRKRDFIVSWNLVARVPLFAELTAQEIAEIVELLTPRETVPGEAIFHRGDTGDGVYFVVSGALRVERDGQSFNLQAGDFFGEIALLQKRDRTATVRAMTSCHLLFLNTQDFNRLLRTNSAVKAHVEKIAKQRVAEMRAPDGT